MKITKKQTIKTESRERNVSRDIYYTREWQELYAERGGLVLDGVSFSCDLGRVEYNFYDDLL